MWKKTKLYLYSNFNFVNASIRFLVIKYETLKTLVNRKQNKRKHNLHILTITHRGKKGNRQGFLF